MATTIQIVVAGALLLAWIWALGRPLAGSVSRSDYRQLGNQPDEAVAGGLVSPPGGRIRESAFVTTFLEWWRRPAVAWRRQLMLATMLATFASFLLAIALRGSFVLLFVLMMAILAIHLVVAASVGGRMLSVERATSVKAAKRRVQRSGGISIRAQQVGVQSSASSPVGDGPAEHGDLVPGSGLDAFDVAAELASQLAETPKPVVPPLIIEDEASEGAVTTAEDLVAEIDSDSVLVSDPAVETSEPAANASDEAETEAEAIFRRAAKDEPTRGRRKAKPIYIESQLDEEDGEFRAKAVNEQ